MENSFLNSISKNQTSTKPDDLTKELLVDSEKIEEKKEVEISDELMNNVEKDFQVKKEDNLNLSDDILTTFEKDFGKEKKEKEFFKEEKKESVRDIIFNKYKKI